MSISDIKHSSFYQHQSYMFLISTLQIMLHQVFTVICSVYRYIFFMELRINNFVVNISDAFISNRAKGIYKNSVLCGTYVRSPLIWALCGRGSSIGTAFCKLSVSLDLYSLFQTREILKYHLLRK